MRKQANAAASAHRLGHCVGTSKRLKDHTDLNPIDDRLTTQACNGKIVLPGYEID
jgi:hypothetical protein